MSIVTDDKDWTWVLREPCPECGLAAAEVDPRDVPALTRESLPRWEAVLRRNDVAERRNPAAWSDLEYACHVRDVFTIMAERLALMLGEPDARFANWDQDATAVEDRYAEQDPADVAPALVGAGEEWASAVEHVPADAWQRVGTRSNGSTFTVHTLVQYCWHDVAHHLVDVDA
jgi:hypothetical protein